jgi:hypothetical protein
MSFQKKKCVQRVCSAKLDDKLVASLWKRSAFKKRRRPTCQTCEVGGWGSAVRGTCRERSAPYSSIARVLPTRGCFRPSAVGFGFLSLRFCPSLHTSTTQTVERHFHTHTHPPTRTYNPNNKEKFPHHVDVQLLLRISTRPLLPCLACLSHSNRFPHHEQLQNDPIAAAGLDSHRLRTLSHTLWQLTAEA